MAELSRAESKRIRSLYRRKGRESEGLFVAEGIRVVEELLGSAVAARLAVVSPALEETERGRVLGDRLRGALEVRAVGRAELSALADTEASQGVLVVAESPERDLESVVPGPRSVVLVLDGVQDPGNLGTLARSAAAFGCDALVIAPGTVDPWNPKAVRAAAGALFRLPVARASESVLAAWAERHGYRSVAADAGGTPVSAQAMGDRVVLVLGNEGAGLSAGMRALCEGRVAVPMRGGTESLNVAVAAGILLYELTKEPA